MGPIIVAFEGKVYPSHSTLAEEYYKTLSQLVVTQPGFISETPFVSTEQKGGQLLYAVFQSEEHVRAWKNDPQHLEIQKLGREKVFVDYRIRSGEEVLVGAEVEVEKDVGHLGEEKSAGDRYLLLWMCPHDAGLDESETGGVSLKQSVWSSLVDSATYENETHRLGLYSWSSLDDALGVKQTLEKIDGGNVRLIRVRRDYGKYQC
jgi:heme-degrading monooxygenase HmoA